MTQITQLIVDSTPISVDFSRYLLVGMRNGNIVECDIDKVIRETIMHSHHDGEVWGLCVLEEHNKYITSCDDNKILMFDMLTRKCIQKGNVVPPVEGQPEKAQAPTKPLRGGASTLSKEPPEKQSRALAWNSK